MFYTWQIGGAQGEGIDSAGELFAMTLHRIGYYCFAYRHYESLVKGGHTYYRVRVGETPVRYHGATLDMLVSLDQRGIDEHLAAVRPGGILLYDATLNPRAEQRGDVVRCPVPLGKIARDLGSPIMKNVVAVGAAAGLLGIGEGAVDGLLEEKFKSKGNKVVTENQSAVQAGYNFVREQGWRCDRGLPMMPEMPSPDRLFISGNEALALGALAGGCRFLAAYPITPATDVMYRMIKHFGQTGGVVMQAEDELAAINMAIGAAFTGVRAMTSTSGPGFSLMMESLGLAGIAEVPLVIINVQRSGPSTGMPTKTEQSDLNEMLYGSHGDIPRIVLAPNTAEECFLFAAEAFNLAEKFQCPVIVTSDMFLGQSRQSIDGLDYDQVTIDRGALVTEAELQVIGAKEFRRYQATESGISPRSIPGQIGGRYVALGNEHDELGYEAEDPPTRIVQVTKRQRKMQLFDPQSLGFYYEGPDDPELLLVGWGSTLGVLSETRHQMSTEGQRVAHLHLGVLMPFPTARMIRCLAGAKHVMVVEQSIESQLGGLIKQHAGGHEKISVCLKYDGDPLIIADVIAACKEVLPHAVPGNV